MMTDEGPDFKELFKREILKGMFAFFNLLKRSL